MEPMKPLFDTKFDESPHWWPASLGEAPSAVGSAQGHRYAYFAASARLAIQKGGSTAIYDTAGYDIQSVSQGSRDGEELVVHDAAGKAIDVGNFKRLN